MVTSHESANLLLLPILPALVERGWVVHVVCSPGPVLPAVCAAGAQVHEIPMSRAVTPARDVRSLAELRQLLRRLGPDVVIGSTPKAGLLSMLAARAAGIPVRVFHVWGARWDQGAGASATLARLADRVAATAATDVLAVSGSLRRLLIEERVTRKPIVVLGHGGSKGVDVSLFTGERAGVLAPGAPRLAFAGRLAMDKGVQDAIAVASEIRRRHAGATLQIVGDVDAAQPISAALVDRLRSTPWIDWRPGVRQEELALLMREWDLLIFPSVREGLPNVVIEAAASGVPAVGWRATGTVDAIVDGRTGRLAPLGDVAALTAAALACLDPSTHARMSDEATAWARESFDSRRVVGAFLDYLDDRDAARTGARR